MSKILRKTAQLFAVNAPANEVTVFASLENGTVIYSVDPAAIQVQPDWGLGWTSSQFEGTRAPYVFDRNSVDLVCFQQIADILQDGIPQWDAGTTYYLNSIVQYNGQKFLSVIDSNLNNAPPNLASNGYWTFINFPSLKQLIPPTRTILYTGTGDYSPPAGVVRLKIRAVGGGGGGWGSSGYGQGGGNTTLQTAGGNMLVSAGGAGGRFDINGIIYPVGGTASDGDININGNGPISLGSANNVGGISVFGGASLGGFTDVPPIPNTGAGGASDSNNNTTAPYQGNYYGGASGAYCEKTIFSPVPSIMPYTVGAGGAGGLGTMTGYAGAGGIMIIDEFYY